MKKFISLLLCFSVISCFLCSCGDTSCDNPDCTCGDTSTEQWQPRADEPWYFSPEMPANMIDPASMYEFDYELYLTQTQFIGVPEYIECTIVNKTGDPAMCQMLFIEKLYPNIYDIYPAAQTGMETRAWVRIPFMAEKSVLENISDNTKSGKIYLEKYLKAEYEFTPGSYRLVVPLYDGTTRYLNFSIYEE